MRPQVAVRVALLQLLVLLHPEQPVG